MNVLRHRTTPAVLAATLVLTVVAVASAGRLGLTSNGSLGAIDWTDTYYRHYLNTDNLSIDVYTTHGGYSPGPQVARLVSQPGGPDIAVFDFTTFNLGAGVELYIVGARPAAILATGAITIAGNIYVRNGYAGGTVAESGAGGPGEGPTMTSPGQGGVGPGYYVAVDLGGFIGYEPLTGGGGGGGSSGLPGQAGYPSKTLVDVYTGPQTQLGGAGGAIDAGIVSGAMLRGGSGGGAGGDRPMWGGPAHYGGSAGGAGGGALMFDTPGDMTVSGTIDADGRPGVVSNGGGGGGGGGGGYVVVQVEGIFTVTPTGRITALGGAGGAGPFTNPVEPYSAGGNGGGGRIDLDVAVPNLVNSGTIDAGLVRAPNRPTLGMALIGSGAGVVTASLGSLNCGTDCTWTYSTGRTVTLIATPADGSRFMGWAGDDDCLDGSVTMDVSKGCAARFERAAAFGLDFNGDGRGDVFRYNVATGAWSMDRFLSGGFNSITGTWSAGWAIRAADFNGDRLTDFFVYNAQNGRWYKCINNGAGGFDYYFGTWSPGWDVHVLNLDADGRSDVFVYNPTTGFWYQCLTETTPPYGGFRAYVPGRWSPGWLLVAERFDADALDDIFVYNRQSGLWYQCLVDGAGGFARYIDGLWSPNWEIVTGDFNGDGLGDVFVYNATSGVWYICRNNGNGFTYTRGSWSPGWQLSTGDFNADGRTDIFVYNPVHGGWYECFSTVDAFDYRGGWWSPGWQIFVTDLDADNRADVVTYNVTTGAMYSCFNVADGVFTWTGGNWGPGWQIVAQHQARR